jgi:hypothetical protein
VGSPYGEGDGREEPTGQLHTCLDGEVVEEIRHFLEWGCGRLGGDTSSGVVGLAAAVSTLAALFFDFPAPGLVAAIYFGLGF